ncbi:RND superfamily putative drug exporter [Nocardia pseudobrasiliensis]|uniref:RND superfamily putative drug exporter n=1 Tax=Nocardia pseudobrasiliensis TaxID=45979 RepID=A0A370IBR2_9NOCA|nr:MMPL family transporter [Nocardia pseudobrasiliensis]RDI66844.1 RND superfamily putative drug exporter [Nocardia pseudobrasiliensis]
MLLARIAEFVLRSPRRIAAWLGVFVTAAAVYGLPVSAQLPAGGYDVPDSESARAAQVLDETFGAGGSSLVFTVTSPSGADSPQARTRGLAVVDALRSSPYATQVISYWTAPATVAPVLIGTDHRTALIAARVTGDDRQAPVRAHDIAAPLIGSSDDITVTAGGQAVAQYEINRQSRVDLIKLEIIATPFTFAALIWIFGGVLAALVPLAVAAFAIAGTAAALRILFAWTDVAVFAVNLATALCLALAVDYTLFILSRYREERGAGMPPDAALRRTLTSAGRTVAYSALTLGCVVATMLVLPMYFLRSLAYAGIAGVAFSLVGALLVAPVLILLLGDRIGRAEPVTRPAETTVWYRTANFAMRHAVSTVLVVTTLFVVVGLPFLGVRLGYPDDRNLPTSASARRTGDLLRAEFPRQNSQGTVYIVMPSAPGDEAVAAYAAALSRVRQVTGVAAPDGIYSGGTRLGTATVDSARHGAAAYLTVGTTLDPFSDAAKRQLDDLKDIAAPADTLFGGSAQRDLDNVRGVTDRVPAILALIALATFVLMFLFTGSLLLPVKALLMNVLSLTAALGAMVWIFQDGHLGGLGTVATGHTNATMPPLLICIAYGLSMDYEIFVLSRMREEWLATGDNRRAVALGLARTGRIVTAAATVMAIVFAAIVTAQVSFMRGLGVGLVVTVLLDAFLIRILLVPAVMRLAGAWNWWAPRPLARWHRRYGLTDKSAPAGSPVVGA